MHISRSKLLQHPRACFPNRFVGTKPPAVLSHISHKPLSIYEQKRTYSFFEPSARCVHVKQLISRSGLGLRHSELRSTHKRCLSTPASGDSASSHGLEQEILIRAQRYGIQTMHELELESGPGYLQANSMRLVDSGLLREDFELWCILLDFQRHTYGDDGIARIWRDLNTPNREVPIPDEGPHADHLWSTFISMGLKNTSFLTKLCNRQRASGAKRLAFPVEVVGGLLASGNPELARQFFRTLRPYHPLKPEGLCRLFALLCRPDTKVKLRDLRVICDLFPRTQIYGEVVPYLCHHDNFEAALEIHDYLVAKADFPQTFEAVSGLIKCMAAERLDIEPFLHHLEKLDVFYTEEARRLYAGEIRKDFGLSQESMDLITQKTFGVQPTKLSDEFIARLFATPSFSFGIILKGLGIFGVEFVGPLSIRQIAITAGTCEVLRDRFASFKKAGIDTGASAYARVLRNLATEGRDTLLSDVLQSDQHPEVFEDLAIQHELLAANLRNQDLRQANTNLAIMMVHEQMSSKDINVDMWLGGRQAAANVLLQSALHRHAWREVVNLTAKMLREGMVVSNRSVVRMFHSVLSKRLPTSRPSVNKEFDDIRFLISLWQDALKSGSQISPAQWREPLRRLGMLGRWADLDKTLFWLATWYSSRPEDLNGDSLHVRLTASQQHFFKRRRNPRVRKSAFQSILSIPLQRAIVEWGLQSQRASLKPSLPVVTVEMGEEKDPIRPLGYLRGVNLLKRLKMSHGIILDRSVIRHACIHHLRVLFAREGFSKRRINRVLRARNTDSLPSYLISINHAWGDKLLPDTSLKFRQLISKRRRIRPRDGRRMSMLKGLDFVSKSMQTLRQRARRIQTTKEGHANDSVDNSVVYEWPVHQGSKQGEESDTTNSKDAESENVVVYSDLFNVSWEDYERSRSDRSGGK